MTLWDTYLKIFVGLYFKTPVPIQPMKAIGASAIANPGAVSNGMVWGSGLFSAAVSDAIICCL